MHIQLFMYINMNNRDN